MTLKLTTLLETLLELREKEKGKSQPSRVFTKPNYTQQLKVNDKPSVRMRKPFESGDRIRHHHYDSRPTEPTHTTSQACHQTLYPCTSGVTVNVN